MRFIGQLTSTAAIGAVLAVAFAAPSSASSARDVSSSTQLVSSSATAHSVAIAKPASASAAAIPAAAPEGCPSGKVCIYADAFYTGKPGEFEETNANWGSDLGTSDGACVAGSTAASDNHGGWNDCVSSIYNNTSSNFYFYINAGCSYGGGYQLEVAADSGRANLNTDIGNHGTGYFNDSLSSDRKGSAGGC